jgi:hypothetical protein
MRRAHAVRVLRVRGKPGSCEGVIFVKRDIGLFCRAFFKYAGSLALSVDSALDVSRETFF